MASVASSPLLNADRVVVVEYPVERATPFRIKAVRRNRRYGRTALAFSALAVGRAGAPGRVLEFEALEYLNAPRLRARFATSSS